MPLTIGVPRETFAGEKRVACVPEVVGKLIKLGFGVTVETNAGAAANFDDAAYQAAGASIAPDAAALHAAADLVFRVRPPTAGEVAQLKPGATLIGFVWPAQNPELMQALAERGLTVLAIDSLPRQLSRAQKMDALTSMASISGYRAVIEAANAFGRFFNGQVTAAGKIPPAIVRANDTRAEVADQVTSLGGEFVKVDYEEEGSGGGGYAKVMSEGFQQAQRAMYAREAKDADIIITTALIPGRPAPKLITAEMVQSMRPGSVIVDMAAEQGGNCELTVPGEAVVRHGVTLIGYTDLASRLARQASTLYSNNLLRLTEELCKTKDGVINVDMEDDALRGLTVIKEGTITWPPPPPKLPAAPPQAKPATAAAAPAKKSGHGHGSAGEPASAKSLAVVFGVGALLFWLVGAYAPASFLSHFTVFVLACFVGYMVIWNVTPALHTPLMSVTNAISSIIAIGALVQIAPPLGADAGDRPGGLILAMSVLALALTAINMFGGFAVTRRMLAMFRK